MTVPAASPPLVAHGAQQDLRAEVHVVAGGQVAGDVDHLIHRQEVGGVGAGTTYPMSVSTNPEMTQALTAVVVVAVLDDFGQGHQGMPADQ